MQINGDKTWTTEHVRPAEGFEYWRGAVHEAFTRLDMAPQQARTFYGRIDGYVVDRVAVNHVRAAQHRAERVSPDIGLDREQFAYVLAPRRCVLNVAQYGRQTQLQPGECALIYCDDPAVLDFRTEIDTWSVQIPVPLLDAYGSALRDAAARNLCRESSLGHSLSTLIEAMPANPIRADQGMARRLSASMIDLLNLAAAEATGSQAGTRDTTRVTSRDVLALIERYFAEPRLSPAHAASVLGISERQLHALLAKEGQSFMRYLKRRRLEEAYQRLKHSHGDGQSVTEVAFACGFSDLSTFNRAFKQAFGASPTQLFPRGRRI